MQEQQLLNGCFKRICELGQGSYGKVYLYLKTKSNPKKFILNKLRKTKQQNTNQYYALKKFNSPLDKCFGVDYPTLRQIRYLTTLDHPNIIKGQQIIYNKKDFKHQIYLVLEYMLQLPRLLRSKSDINSQANLKIIAYHILLGLDYLHKNMIFHRDIKPQNIFVNKQGIVKIADFGFSREFGTPRRAFTPGLCTIDYRAPEIFFHTKYYTQKSDIWSYGCILAFIHTKKCIFPSIDNNHLQVLKRIFYLLGTPTQQTWEGHQNFPKIFKFSATLPKQIDKQLGVSKQTARIIEWCLKLDPRKRPSTTELLDDDYFQGLEDKCLSVNKYYEQQLNSLINRRNQ